MSTVNALEPDELARRLVDEAGRILSSDGAAALTLRRLATAVGISTMPVYTLFGDKRGLLTAMYREGYRRLGEAMHSAAAGEAAPLDALAVLGHAYRRTALENPHLYDLMFGRPVPAFEPGTDDQRTAEAAYRPLVDVVQRCLDAGALQGGEAERIALHLWSVSHGMISLELAGHLTGDPASAYDEAMVLASLPFLPPPHQLTRAGASAR